MMFNCDMINVIQFLVLLNEMVKLSYAVGSIIHTLDASTSP